MRKRFFTRHTIVKVSASTHRGKVRKNNEDSYRILLPNSSNRLKESIFVLADGMGGHNKGEIASSMAVSLFIDYYKFSKKKNLTQKIYTALIQTNKSVYTQSLKNSEYSGMGTTIAILVIYNDFAVIANIGDSRVYYFTDNQLHQISEDHSWVKEIGLSEEEAKIHPKRNVITRTIGKKDEVVPYLHTLPIKKGDIFLLCSDGLTNHVSDQNIKKVLESNANLHDKQKVLLKLALDGGGSDNITIILAQPKKVKSSKRHLRKQWLIISFLFSILILIGIVFSIHFYSNFENTITPYFIKTTKTESPHINYLKQPGTHEEPSISTDSVAQEDTNQKSSLDNQNADTLANNKNKKKDQVKTKEISPSLNKEENM